MNVVNLEVHVPHHLSIVRIQHMYLKLILDYVQGQHVQWMNVVMKDRRFTWLVQMVSVEVILNL